MDLKPKAIAPNTPTAVAIPNKISVDLQALDEKVKSMMEKGQKMIPVGKHPNGTPKQAVSFICKVCGKEGHITSIRDHIEYNHLQGICIPCGVCDKPFSSRATLRKHKNRSCQ